MNKMITEKNRRGRIWILMAMVTVCCMGFLSSCDDDDDWYGPSRFYDNRLNGYWELVEYNDQPVYADDVNYMYFGGNGYGYYYYWENGRRYLEDLYYESQEAVNGYSDYQLNLQYGNSRPTTVNYWFENRNVLCMQWMSGYNRLETYVYERVYGAPW